MYGPHPDDLAPMATMADAHREWHLNAGVPLGMPGCPQDACHPPDEFYDDDLDGVAVPEPPPAPWGELTETEPPPF